MTRCSFTIIHHSWPANISTNINNLQQFHKVEFRMTMNLTSWLSFIIRHRKFRNMCLRRFTHRGMDPSITYLLFTKLPRWTRYRHTTHESAYPTWRFNNASVTRYDDIFVLRGPQTRRHLAHRDRKTTHGHVEYITTTENTQCDSSTPPIPTNLQKI